MAKITIDTAPEEKAVGQINQVLTTARIIKNTMGRSSLTRAAKDSVFQYPLLVSAGIDTDVIMVIARALERQYASMVVSWASREAGVDIDKYGTLTNYLKHFHNNDDIPSNIKATPVSATLDSALFVESVPNTKGLGTACWGNDVENNIVTESVNDIYRPYDRTMYVLEKNLNDMKITKESLADDLADTAKKAERAQSNSRFGGINPEGKVEYQKTHWDATAGQKIGDIHRDAITGKNVPTMVSHIIKATPQFKQNAKIATPNEKISALEPTLVTCTFVMHGEKGNNTQWTQDVVLGVKCMVRMIRPDFMVSNMADAAKNSNSIFKFIKWTKGEYGLLDLLFNKSEIKDMATTSKNDSSHWWKALSRRKMINSVTKMFDQGRVLPSTTIIMTPMEVQQVADITGIDLSQEYNAMKLISKYYLLGFGIYDDSTGILSTIFDGDTEGFANVSLSSLKGLNDKPVNVMSDKDMRRMMGRV